MTDKGINKTGASLPPITAPTPAAPASSPAAPTPVTPAASPTAPSPAGDSTAVLPTTSASAPAAPTPAPSAARAAHVGRRRHRTAADHHATPAPATSAPADDETEGSEETEQVHLTREEAIAAAKKEVLEEAAAKKEKKKLKNRAKRAPKAFLTWLGKWCKKHWFITAILVVAIIASLTMWVNGKFADDNAASSEPRLSAPKGIMPGGDEGSQRGSKADNAPTVKDDGDALTFEYTDPNFQSVTFQVITDNDLNIREVKLGDKLKEYGGKLSIGTVDGSQESDVRCSRNAQNCDFSDEKLNICKSWLSLSRIIPIAGGSDQAQPFWTSLEVYNATPVGTYTSSADLPHHCGVKDSDTSS